jgi:uncharacterized membrane protein
VLEALGILIVVLLFVIGSIAVVIAPVLAIVAFLRTRGLTELRNRLHVVERQLRRQQAGAAPLPIEDVLPARAVPSSPPPEVTRRPRRAELLTAQDSVGIESFIGRRILAWIAATLLVLSASFFLNFAFKSKMIGPAGQVAIGAAIGTALCGWGFQRHWHGKRISCQIITGTGIIILFLSIYASFSIYRLLTPSAAGLYLAALMSEAAALAVLYRSPTIAFLAVGGALLTPVLIRSEGDPYRSYFIYLATLNLVVQGLYALRPWPGLRALTLLGSQLLFWLWFDDRYHPDKATAVLVFQGLMAAIYLLPDWIAAVRQRSQIEDWALMFVTPWFLFLVMHRVLGEFHPSWMGSLALVMAMAYTLFAAAAVSRKFVSDPIREMIFLGTALAFLGLSFPLQAKSYWATVGWAAEGAALWWLGLRIRSWALRGAGAVFLVLCCIGALYVMVVHAPEVPYIPVLNQRTLPVIAAAAGLFAAAWAARMFQERLQLLDSVVRYGTGLVGIGLVWLVMSLETWDGVDLLLTDSDERELIMQTALSFIWALYAAVLLTIGFRLNHAPTRWTALGLFAVTLLKLLFYDLSELAGVYRVLTFLMGAVVLTVATWAYRRIQLTHPAGANEVSDD